MNIYLLNSALKYTLKVLRKLHLKVFNSPNTQLLQYESDPNIASDMIFNMLTSNSPCMIARYGAFELSAIVNYIGVNKESRSFIKYIKGEVPDWWWNSSIFNYMHNNAGFFPPTPESISEFSKLMLKDSEEVDILGSWQQNEQYLQVELSQSQRIKLIYIDPFWSARPWSRALRDKKILVVHPFAETILSQYEKRDLLFDNKEILPEFRSLQVIKAIQSLGGDNSQFRNWFDALEYMKSEIDKQSYDICLLGCGAYGFPLAAHIKRSGKMAVHMGGSLQLLFGIRGKRWESQSIGYQDEITGEKRLYADLMNEHWVRPVAHITSASSSVEGGCYW